MEFWIVGLLLIVVLIASLAPDGGDPSGRNTCRAANPGYECVRGWVKGEPFKP